MSTPQPNLLMATPEPALQAYLADCRERVGAALEQWLPPQRQPPQTLHAAMRYATLGDGKRIRPVLVYGAGRALGVEPARLDGAACAVELIHAYSLVHDDLPAMDDDALRRGRPTCHMAFDEATAILAGDALQTLAFQVLCRDPQPALEPAARLAMLDTSQGGKRHPRSLGHDRHREAAPQTRQTDVLAELPQQSSDSRMRRRALSGHNGSYSCRMNG